MPAVFFLIGEGSNGKSVLINTLVNLFGEGNTCSISLNSLTNEYHILDLFGKMINISSETPQRKQINTDIIKAVVAGDWVTGREPSKPPTKFRAYAKHYLAMNESPVINDNTHGMWRRIYVIEFLRKFSEAEMDTELSNKLLNELPGIFNWALEGYLRLRENSFRFNEAESMKKAKQKFRSDADSISAFINDRIIKSGSDNKIKLSVAFQNYQIYCQQEGYTNPEKKKAVEKAIRNCGYKLANSTKDNNQVYIFGANLVGE
jgi:putative DNA primase/helicase